MTWTKEDAAEYGREYRKKNKNKIKKQEWKSKNKEALYKTGVRYRLKNKERIKKYNKKRRIDNFEVINAAKEGGCARCGFKHIAAMDFHHRDPETKIDSIGNMDGASVEKIKEEVAKCDVLCSNCHRILHYNEKLEKENEL